VHDHGDLAAVPFRIDRAKRRRQNARLVETVARDVAVATEQLLRAGELPLVVGGECTIILGVLAGCLEVLPDLGLLYLDAHPDLNTPESVVQGALDWMGMAHVLGEPDAVPSLSHLGPRFPLLSWDRVLFFAAVESELTGWERELIRSRGGRLVPATEVAGNARQAASRAVKTLTATTTRYVVHFDADALDFVDLPIADNAYQRNQGLSLDDVMTALSTLSQTPSFGGLVLTEVNPDHAAAQPGSLDEFVSRLAGAFSGSDAPRSGDDRPGRAGR
jgi:arginase